MTIYTDVTILIGTIVCFFFIFYCFIFVSLNNRLLSLSGKQRQILANVRENLSNHLKLYMTTKPLS